MIVRRPHSRMTGFGVACVVSAVVVGAAFCGDTAQSDEPPRAKRPSSTAASWDLVYRHMGSQYVHEPSEFLVRCVERVERERRARTGAKALVLAMGDGRNAVYLAAKGFDVTGTDISPVALELAQGAAKKQGLEIHAIQADLFKDDLGEATWDLVTNIYYNPAIKVMDRMKAAVRPGGLLLIEGYGAEHTGSGPPAWSRYEPNQLLEALSGWHILAYEDGVFPCDWASGKELPVVRVLAQKPDGSR